MNTMLVVPSRERAKWLRSRKTCTLAQVAHLKPYLYVRDDDSELGEYTDWAKELDVPLWMQDSKKALGAAQTYDSLIEAAIRGGHERLVVLDDDLTFSIEDPNLDAIPRYRKANARELSHVMRLAANVVRDELPACSLTPIMKRSAGGGSVFEYATSLMWTYIFWLPHFAKHPEHRFWEGKHIEARCDLNLSLKLLTSGYLTGVYTGMFVPDNVNNPGGCSTYRTIELERASIDYLKRTYPDVVRTRKKFGWIEGPDVEREAPVIAWKRAFDREKFRVHFGREASDFARKHAAIHGVFYADFAQRVKRGEFK